MSEKALEFFKDIFKGRLSHPIFSSYLICWFLQYFDELVNYFNLLSWNTFEANAYLTIFVSFGGINWNTFSLLILGQMVLRHLYSFIQEYIDRNYLRWKEEYFSRKEFFTFKIQNKKYEEDFKDFKKESLKIRTELYKTLHSILENTTKDNYILRTQIKLNDRDILFFNFSKNQILKQNDVIPDDCIFIGRVVRRISEFIYLIEFNYSFEIENSSIESETKDLIFLRVSNNKYFSVDRGLHHSIGIFESINDGKVKYKAVLGNEARKLFETKKSIFEANIKPIFTDLDFDSMLSSFN
ncbi:MAG: hypothetical protein MH321_03120 [Leptospiraceae bacterium]|nr:hypothetical protein [Leptospiraceae bacterium]